MINDKLSRKKVTVHYKKNTLIPKTWTVLALNDKKNDLCDFVSGEGFPIKYQGITDSEYPFVKVSDMSIPGNEIFIKKTNNSVSSEVKKKLQAQACPKNTIIFPKIGEVISLNRRRILLQDSCFDNNIMGIVPKNIDPLYLFYQLQQIKLQYFQQITAVPYLDDGLIQNLKIPICDIEEQEQIGMFIHQIDLLIVLYQRIISKQKIIKQFVIQFLTKNGLNKNKSNLENLGKRFLNEDIPENWDVYEFGKALNLEENSIELDDLKKYSRVTVKRRHEGVVLRDELLGKDILVQNQFKINSGDFIISRRQIIHNACGLIPTALDSAVVSNEYSCYSGTELLDIRYFDLFAQTKLFQQTIAVTTQGVDIEKYIFLQDEWLELKMPIPPPDEQEKIISIADSIELEIENYRKYKIHLEKLKVGLMQQLLFGKIRFSS